MAFEPIDISTEFKSDFFYYGKILNGTKFLFRNGKKIVIWNGKIFATWTHFGNIHLLAFVKARNTGQG